MSFVYLMEILPRIAKLTECIVVHNLTIYTQKCNSVKLLTVSDTVRTS